MNLDFLLYWAMLATSLFNTIVLFWLGFTVWLNAESSAQRRRGIGFGQVGIWIATSGLLLGGVFFATHTAMLDFQVEALVAGVRSWWYGFFTPIILLPHAWYLLMLWYAGFWDDRSSFLHQRHRAGLLATTLLVIALIALLFIANPFAVAERSTAGIVHAGFRLLPYAAIFYPLYILSCTALALDALHRPAPSGRMMGDLARRRARPWLLAATLVQLAVSLLVGGAFAWLIFILKFWDIGRILSDGAPWIDRLDFLLTALLALTIILAGKAIVSYEIFTGKTLPRRGFLRQWRGVVSVAAVSSTLIAWCISTELRPIYALLLVVILATATFALLGWRFFGERETIMAQLRPFATSQHLMDRVLASRVEDAIGGDEINSENARTFRALCSEVLETRGARLIPLGALMPLVEAPLCFPNESSAPVLPTQFEMDTFSPHHNSIALTTEDGVAWAIPLWSAQTLCGVLLLQEKQNDALYAEEEIALAQAAGERILDALAGAALASRLMELQRRKHQETPLPDGQSTLRLRRALHDEILPRLHAALLQINGDDASRKEAQTQIADAHHEISALLRDLPSALPTTLSQLGLFGALQRTLHDEFDGVFDDATFEIEEQAQAQVLPDLHQETLYHAAREAIRNAARHARSTQERALNLRISARIIERENVTTGPPSQTLEIAIEDDGIGAPAHTASRSGGHGLALHSTMMAVIGGTLVLESTPPRGTRVTLKLPVDSSRADDSRSA